MSDESFIGRYVLVRTADAGVHFGLLKARTGNEVELTDARIIWRWRGANTCHEVSLYGVDEGYTRISEPVAEALVFGAISIFPTTEKATENLKRSRWEK